MTEKWIEVNDLSGSQNYINKNTRCRIPILRSDLCDYGDTYIVVKGKTDLLSATAANDDDKAEKDVALEKCCI